MVANLFFRVCSMSKHVVLAPSSGISLGLGKGGSVAGRWGRKQVSVFQVPDSTPTPNLVSRDCAMTPSPAISLLDKYPHLRLMAERGLDDVSKDRDSTASDDQEAVGEVAPPQCSQYQISY